MGWNVPLSSLMFGKQLINSHLLNLIILYFTMVEVSFTDLESF